MVSAAKGTFLPKAWWAGTPAPQTPLTLGTDIVPTLRWFCIAPDHSTTGATSGRRPNAGAPARIRHSRGVLVSCGHRSRALRQNAACGIGPSRSL